MNSETDPESEAIDLNIDLRSVDTHHAISAMRKYLEVMEQQMPIVEACEIAVLEAERPVGADEDEQLIFASERNYLEQLFEEDLVPTMRYSFIVFLHTVFETRLRAFCAAMQRERHLPINLSEIRGSAVEQARTYLVKLAGIAVADFPEWSRLRGFQAVRDCIVHHYGYLRADEPRHRAVRALASEGVGVSITHDDRILVTASFCEQHLAHIASLFDRLFDQAGWPR